MEDVVDEVPASARSTRRKLRAIIERAKDLEFKAVYDFFELAYRDAAGLIVLLKENNEKLARCMRLARAISQPNVSIVGVDDSMTASKRLGLGRKI